MSRSALLVFNKINFNKRNDEKACCQGTFAYTFFSFRFHRKILIHKKDTQFVRANPTHYNSVCKDQDDYEQRK